MARPVSIRCGRRHPQSRRQRGNPHSRQRHRHSAEVKDKMFNPFFTTKPAGEGTGLGLSMSHDIIVKQHGGTIDVDTEPGHFTEFRIVLPSISNSSNKNQRSDVNILVLVVDDEPDVEALFRQQFRRDLRAQRFVMDFAISAADALARDRHHHRAVADPDPVRHQHARHDRARNAAQGQGNAARRSRHHDHRLWRSRDQAQGDRRRCDGVADQADRFHPAAGRDRHAAGTGRSENKRAEPRHPSSGAPLHLSSAAHDSGRQKLHVGVGSFSADLLALAKSRPAVDGFHWIA